MQRKQLYEFHRPPNSMATHKPSSTTILLISTVHENTEKAHPTEMVYIFFCILSIEYKVNQSTSAVSTKLNVDTCTSSVVFKCGWCKRTFKNVWRYLLVITTKVPQHGAIFYTKHKISTVLNLKIPSLEFNWLLLKKNNARIKYKSYLEDTGET